MRRRLGRPSPALVISLIALFVALGGTGYAALKVSGKNVKNRSLTGKDIKRNSLGRNEVKESSLAKVGSAGRADSAGVAGAAGTAGDASALGGRAPSSYLPGPFVRATLINGWQQLPDGQIPGYWAGPGPVASVKGSIKSGATATVAFTLPPGVRPRRSVTERIDCPGDGTPGKVSISLTGGVVISDVGGSICGGATGFALIPTVTFRTDN